MADPVETVGFGSPYTVSSHLLTQVNVPPGGTFDILETFSWMTLETGINVQFFFNGMPPGVDLAGRTGFEDIPDKSFRFVRVKNTDPALTQTISVRYGTGKLIDNRIGGTVIVTTTPGVGIEMAKPTQSNTAQFAVANVAVQLRGQVAGRYSLSIMPGQTDDIYIGNSNAVTALNGFLVEADSTYVLESIDECWGIRTVAVASNCTTREEIY